MLRLALAMLRRDLQEARSRPVGMIQQVSAMAVVLAVLLGIDALWTHPQGGAVPGSYFLYALFGIMGLDLLWHAAVVFSDRTHAAWRAGLLDTCATGPIKPWWAIVVQPVTPLALCLTRLLAYGVMAAALRPTELSLHQLPVAGLFVAMGLLVFFSWGALCSALGVWMRVPDPLGRTLAGLSILTGGVFFPVTLLPDGLEGVVRWFPLTALLDGMRGALLHGNGLMELASPLLRLGTMAALGPVILWCALVALQRQLRHMKPPNN